MRRHTAHFPVPPLHSLPSPPKATALCFVTSDFHCYGALEPLLRTTSSTTQSHKIRLSPELPPLKTGGNKPTLIEDTQRPGQRRA